MPSTAELIVADWKDKRDVRAWAREIERVMPARSLEVTVADTATRSGLTLAQADKALNWLLNEYRGRLAVGNEGDLIYRFPRGFSKPWQTRETLKNTLMVMWKKAQPVIKVALKVWILVVIVLYVIIFLAIMLGLLFASKGRDGHDRRRSNSDFGSFVIIRLLFELVYDAFWAMFWFGGRTPRYAPRRLRQHSSGRRFYQDVFQFIFGPEEPERDTRADQKDLLNYIRARQGRVVVGDVVALLGCSIPEAEKVLTRLSIDYNGDVSVDEDGSIIFAFPDLLKTVDREAVSSVPMSWDKPVTVPPLTGNKHSSNLVIMLLNGFNLVMSTIAMWTHLTVKNVLLLANGVPLDQLTAQSTAIFLGVIPFVFSLFIFLLPLGRWLVRRNKVKQALRANGLRAIVRAVFAGLRFRMSRKEFHVLYQGQGRTSERTPAYESGLPAPPAKPALDSINKKDLNNCALDLEANLDMTDEGDLNYHFERFEREYHSVRKVRQTRSDHETSVGDIVFE
ncbi:hypothetical protein JXQ70_11010 [bacterium]|nr:hypothetical protein [bacterium]